MRITGFLPFVVLLSALAMFVSACGSSGSSSSTGGGSTNPPAGSTEGESTGAADGAEAELQEEGVTDFKEFLGGKGGKADPNASPVTIGLINNQGGGNVALDNPFVTEGAEAAIEYINQETGGIEGHPLKLETCFVASAVEEGQRCGQQMVNDSSVSSIIYGALQVGSATADAAIAGAKPVVVAGGSEISTGAAPNTYMLYGDAQSVLAPIATYIAEYAKAESVAIIYPKSVFSTISLSVIRPALEELGVKIKAVGFSESATDMTGPLTAAGAQDADLIYPLTQTAGCIDVAEALDQLGLQSKPVLTTGAWCYDPSVKEALGDYPEWTIASPGSQFLLDTSQPAVKVYTETVEAAGVSAPDAAQQFTAAAFGSVLTLGKIMNELGYKGSTPEKIAQKLKSYPGPLPLGPPRVECGEFPKRPAVCSSEALFYKYEGGGQFKTVTPWLAAPTG